MTKAIAGAELIVQIDRVFSGRDRVDENFTRVSPHSAANPQFAGLRSTERLAEVCVIASMETIGDNYDNARTENVTNLDKTECVKKDDTFRSANDLELAMRSWVHSSTRTNCTPRSGASHPTKEA